jgi:hypothetical protein
MNNVKLATALNTLKANTKYAVREEINTEENFNNIEWVTGVDASGNAITTTTCPHSEITWAKLKEEMDKIQVDYDAQDYARKRKAEYPSVQDLVVALYDTEDKAAIDAKRAEIKLKYPKT